MIKDNGSTNAPALPWRFIELATRNGPVYISADAIICIAPDGEALENGKRGCRVVLSNGPSVFANNSTADIFHRMEASGKEESLFAERESARIMRTPPAQS